MSTVERISLVGYGCCETENSLVQLIGGKLPSPRVVVNTLPSVLNRSRGLKITPLFLKDFSFHRPQKFVSRLRFHSRLFRSPQVFFSSIQRLNKKNIRWSWNCTRTSADTKLNIFYLRRHNSHLSSN
jgi:hypothetical protein